MSSENAPTGTPVECLVGRTAIDAARRLLLPRNVVSDDFNELIANCQQHNLDVAIVAEAYLRSELKIESMAEWCLDERKSGNGVCGACSICCAELLAKIRE